jgi:hypothetical protein
MRGLLSAHMFIGLVLIPPVVLKLCSTGYRMVSYYAGSRAYRLAGPPWTPLRLIAPVLGTRAMLVAAAVGGGAALALALLPTIHAYGR